MHATTTIQWSGNTSGAGSAVAAPGVDAGDKVVSVVRNDNGEDVTSNYAPICPGSGIVVQLFSPIAPGTLSTNTMLTLTFKS